MSAEAWLLGNDTELQIHNEVARQHELWGEQNHADGTGKRLDRLHAANARLACDIAHNSGHGTWRHILDEEVKEVFAETDPTILRAELIQVAAVCISWIEAIDRRKK